MLNIYIRKIKNIYIYQPENFIKIGIMNYKKTILITQGFFSPLKLKQNKNKKKIQIIYA